MNFLFLSPHFPPHFLQFVRALNEAGVRVLGLGDSHHGDLSADLQRGMTEYYHAPDMTDLDAMTRAAGYVTWKYGKLDRIESLNEHWLQVEAELRQNFNVVGMTPDEVRTKRSKWQLFQIFLRAKIPTIPTEQAVSAQSVKAFAKTHGYPLVLKPAVGVGSVDAVKLRNDADVDARMNPVRPDFLVQAYQQGVIVTYDGLTDREGNIVFALSHEYSDGVMETVAEQRDMYFWSKREIPAALEALGRSVVATLELKERWFHLEFFRTPKGDYVALEANLRPPGGFMTDMMNYACDMDVYKVYAELVAGRDPSRHVRPAKHHVCHVARHKDRPYLRTREQVARELGENLIWARDLPPLFAAVMGDEMYLTRHATEDEMMRDVKRIQALG